MNKSQLINQIYNKKHGRYDIKIVEDIINTVFGTIAEQLMVGSTVSISEFGVFNQKIRGAKDIVNVRTKVRTHYEQRKTVGFTPSKMLKELVN